MALEEILRRKTTFGLAVLAVAIAAGTMVSVCALLKTYRMRSQELLARKEVELQEKLATLQDEMRKATLKLSFNLQILPGRQDMRQWHDKDVPTAYMPEEYVHQMAASRLLSVRHFFPMLSQKVKWPEMKRTVFLVGCKGEVPNLHKSHRAPLVQPVPDGMMIVGYELHQSLGLKEGQTVQLTGRDFTVHKCYPQRGTRDDIGVWIPLTDAQRLLDKPGLINAILALECSCVGQTGVERIRAEIAKCLPDTRVVEFGTKVLARNEAREKVKQEAARSLEREKNSQQALAVERENLAAFLLPGVFLACTVWVFFLAFANARRRRPEVAILRAIGYASRQILGLLLFRSLAGGAVGALLGCLSGLLIAARLGGEFDVPLVAATGILSWRTVGATLLIASLIGVVAGWIPALVTSQRDPSEILKET
jgi:ABC-type lipoprotein release transport system permease subunit